MRTFLAGACIAAALALAACENQQASEMHDMDHMNHSASASMAIPANAVDLHNTVCPVSGQPVTDPKNFVVYQGKVYHFCCGDCPKEFQQDPQKYAKAVAADPAKYGVKSGT